MDSDDILDGLDDILGAAMEQPEPAPVAQPPAKRTRRTKAEMAAANAAVLPPAPAPAPAPKLDPMSKQHGFSGKRVKIVVERGHNPEDSPVVFVRLNDYACQITRGEPVEVPVEVLGVLNDARQTVFSQPTSGVLVPHDSLRFSYSRV